MSSRHVEVYEGICRLCQSSGSELLNIFEHEYEGLHLTTKIMACAAVTVFEGDGLPPQICRQCMQSVNCFFTFKQTCQRSDAELRRRVQSRPQEDDVFKLDLATSVKVEIVEEDGFYNAQTQEFTDGNKEEEKEDNVDGFNPQPSDSPLNLSVTSKCSQNLEMSCPVVVKQEMPSVKMEADTSIINESSSAMASPPPFPRFEEYEGLLSKLVEALYPREKGILSENCANALLPIEPPKTNMMGSLLLYQTLAGNVDSKPFPCHLCGKAFRKKSGLTDHVRAHVNSKPYKCRYCWKSYAQRAGLRSHERLHEGTQAFVCRVCQKAFTQRSHLVEHLRIHTGWPAYSSLIG